MLLGYVLVAIVAAAVAVFALQNSQQTSIRFLKWTLDGLPLSAAILAALAAGLVIAGVPFSIRSWRWRSRAQALERRVAGLESTLAERQPSRPPRPEP
jgi:uncharacterized integral membrane protein